MRPTVEMDGTGEGGAARIAAFGRWLAQERELRGLSRADVAATTRLPPALVEALESGDEARMPPSAYVVGYLRSYAGAVGLDADEVLLRWQEASAPPPGPEPQPKGRSVRTAVALILALALAGAGAWAFFALG